MPPDDSVIAGRHCIMAIISDILLLIYDTKQYYFSMAHFRTTTYKISVISREFNLVKASASQHKDTERTRVAPCTWCTYAAGVVERVDRALAAVDAESIGAVVDGRRFVSVRASSAEPARSAVARRFGQPGALAIFTTWRTFKSTSVLDNNIRI